jgi:hypothetical protein
MVSGLQVIGLRSVYQEVFNRIISRIVIFVMDNMFRFKVEILGYDGACDSLALTPLRVIGVFKVSVVAFGVAVMFLGVTPLASAEMDGVSAEVAIYGDAIGFGGGDTGFIEASSDTSSGHSGEFLDLTCREVLVVEHGDEFLGWDLGLIHLISPFFGSLQSQLGLDHRFKGLSREKLHNLYLGDIQGSMEGVEVLGFDQSTR